MKGKKIRIELLIGVLLLAIISGAAGVILPLEREPDSVLRNRFGDVTWNHELHARMEDIANCTVCHHTTKQGEMSPQSCQTCHKLPDNVDDIITPELFTEPVKVTYEGKNGPPAMTAFHGNCLGCHRTMKKGPTICRDCHAQKFTGSHGLVQWNHTVHSRKLDMKTMGGGKDCVSCHHKDTDAETEADYRACGTCHKSAVENALSLSTGIKDHQNVKHGQCQNCHVEFNPEEDNVACVDCHKGLVVDPEKIRPSIEQAVHKKCGTCHNKDYPNLEASMPMYCGDCHQPNPSLLTLSRNQTILWDHKKHGEYGDVKCQDCHHKDHADAPKMACRSCHGKDLYDNPPFEDALKKVCVDCHKKKGVGLELWKSMVSHEQTPSHMKIRAKEGEFWWNHQFHAIDISLSCRNCHHNIIKKDGQYATALKAGKEWTEKAGEIQKCSNCHGPYGPVRGSVAQNTGAKKLEIALKNICTNCHQKLEGGPQSWEDYFQN